MKKTKLPLVVLFVLAACISIAVLVLHSYGLYLSAGKAYEVLKNRSTGKASYNRLLDYDSTSGNKTAVLGSKTQLEDNASYENYVIVETQKKGVFWTPGHTGSISIRSTEKEITDPPLFLDCFISSDSSVIIYGICADNAVQSLRISVAVNTDQTQQWSYVTDTKILQNTLTKEADLVFCDLSEYDHLDSLLFLVEAIDSNGFKLWEQIIT